jgi:hypothetical protein
MTPIQSLHERSFKHRQWPRGSLKALGCLPLFCAMVLLSFVCVPAFAAQGPLLDLYRGFLQDGNRNVFVAFEKERIFPKADEQEREISLPEGRVAVFRPQGRTFVSFGSRGAQFVIGTSAKHGLLRPDDLVSADTVEGFNDAEYWIFDLNTPVKMFTLNEDGQPKGMPIQQFNRLTLIPLSEAARKQGIYQGDITLATLQAKLAECLMVVQMGYDRKLLKPPARSNSQLTLSPETGSRRQVRIVGSHAAPKALLYEQPSETIAVEFDYATDTLHIKRTSGEEVRSEVRYRILAFDQMRLEHEPLLSWEFYKGQEGAADVIATVRTNGGTARAEFQEGGTFIPGEIIGEAIRTGSEPKLHQKWILFVLLMLVALGIALPLFARFRGKPQQT